MKYAKAFFLSAAWVSGCLAQSACSGQQYNDIPGFPAQQSACYPTNYYRTSDLGQTSPSDAQSRCQSQCTADSSCGSVVAQVNNAAGNPGFYPSGTCFFYAKGQTVTPRQCANTAYLLEGYMKDSTNACFSSSSVAASAFCSSYLHIPVITSTVTSTPAPTTVTVTTTTSPTVTTTTTSSATLTRTVTVTVTSTTTAGTNTITATATTSTTVTATATATTTVTVPANKKRAERPGARFPVKRGLPLVVRPATDLAKRAAAAATVPAPACVTSGTPSTRLSAACSCLSVPTSTTTTTTTLPRVTSTNTATSTVTVTSTSSVTVTSATVTNTATVTTTTGITATTTVTTTTTNTGTTTTTTTVTATATAAPACTSGLQCIDGNQFETFCQESINPQGYSPSVTLGGVANGQACLQDCSNDPQCNLYNYFYDTQVCTLYYQVPSSANLQYVSNIEAASGYYTGSC